MFNVRTFNGSDYQAIVTAMNYESSLEELPQIEDKLRGLIGVGRSVFVILDLLCSNGVSWNRFFSAKFNGQELDVSSFTVLPVENIDKEIIRAQKEFFRESGALKASVLSRKQAQMVLA